MKFFSGFCLKLHRWLIPFRPVLKIMETVKYWICLMFVGWAYCSFLSSFRSKIKNYYLIMNSTNMFWKQTNYMLMNFQVEIRSCSSPMVLIFRERTMPCDKFQFRDSFFYKTLITTNSSHKLLSSVSELTSISSVFQTIFD